MWERASCGRFVRPWHVVCLRKNSKKQQAREAASRGDAIPDLRADPRPAGAVAQPGERAPALPGVSLEPDRRLAPLPHGGRILRGVREPDPRRYGKPEWGFKTTRIINLEVPVREHFVAATPFCNLLHFDRDDRVMRHALRSQGADRRAAVGPLRDAAARHRPGDAARARCLHHRLDATRATSRSPWAASISTTSSTTSSSSSAFIGTGHPRDRRLPAGGAGAGRGGAHGQHATIPASRPR